MCDLRGELPKREELSVRTGAQLEQRKQCRDQLISGHSCNIFKLERCHQDAKFSHMNALLLAA